ncbi:tetratricopeptide repeat protein [Pseudomonas kitaguniensis]|uniref:tetratricopeptide repeat protein n=1 Tax=Pseudomonas kitaguniensis TaxID=2607908 RepID=UPI003D05AE5F
MKIHFNIVFSFSALLFSVSAMAGNNLSLYASSSGSAVLTEADNHKSILVFAGGDESGEATAGGCVVAANLLTIKGGFEGKLVPVTTEINSYDKSQAQGRSISIEMQSDAIVINDVDFVGLCSLDSSLVNVYQHIGVSDRRYKNIYAEMMEIAHTDALAMFKGGRVMDAITRLSSFADGYDVSWLTNKDVGRIVISAINDYAFFLQQNNSAMESITFLNDVVSTDPGRAVAWLNLADSNWIIDKNNEAVKQYIEYKKLMLLKDKKSKIPLRVIERINTPVGS